MSHPKQGGVALTDTKAERRTASECVRTYRPKGVAVASERAREAHRMYRVEHVPIAEIAAHLGVSPAMVHQYVRRVEEQIAERSSSSPERMKSEAAVSLREHGVPDRMSDHLALGGAACERSIRALAEAAR